VEMSDILISGDLVFLRERLVLDAHTFVRWRTQGEWRLFDAQWEEVQRPLAADPLSDPVAARAQANPGGHTLHNGSPFCRT